MKHYIYLLAVIALLTLATADYTCTTQSYNQFRQNFNKNQNLTPEQYQSKFNKFCWTIQNVQQLNRNSPSASYSVNQFADFLDQDNKKLLNAQRPLGKGAPASSVPIVRAGVQAATPPNFRPQASAIKDQGTCGACWAFTSVGLYQTFLKVKGKAEQDLSEQFLLECTNTLNPNNYVSDCTGGFTDFALNVVKQYGIPKQSAWPYKAATYGSVAGFPTSPGICSTTANTFVKHDKTNGAKAEVNVTRYDNITVNTMEQLLEDGPVGALMYVDTTFQAYSGGVYTSCPNFANAFASINHAVVIVGMDENKNYIIKNSWGTRWGDSGFATVSSVNDCALTAYVFKISWGYQLLGSSLIFFLALLFMMM